MESPIIKDFIPGAKVFLDNEFGVVLNESRSNCHGIIRWDTPDEKDLEDWIGLFGTFTTIGGKIVNFHEFEYINDDGSLKK
ncbi:hypothetical protein [Chryseobacterium defluvii]|uniref:Uncharacterized protein n=1 Tax=Chryseobacterium defluvii TaxID=160396 RepID=A0A495SPM7_9FLAO|nr:hypothetical protein [Chryseobacterium defluvii]RKT01380.1 hypothetical protein BCF58_0599 [Chryseobacterium defluvii]